MAPDDLHPGGDSMMIAFLRTISDQQTTGFKDLKQEIRDLREATAAVAQTVGEHAVQIEGLGRRATNLEHEVFDRPQRRTGDGPLDWRKVLAALGAIVLAVWGGVEAVFQVGDWLHKAGLR